MRKKKIDAFPYLMCLAAVVLFTLFVVLPFAVGVYTSFFKWDGFNQKHICLCYSCNGIEKCDRFFSGIHSCQKLFWQNIF